jgi:hypothetical protein
VDTPVRKCRLTPIFDPYFPKNSSCFSLRSRRSNMRSRIQPGIKSWGLFNRLLAPTKWTYVSVRLRERWYGDDVVFFTVITDLFL